MFKINNTLKNLLFNNTTHTKTHMKIQKQTFQGGVFEPNSFVLHKITGRFTGKCSAWFLADGSCYDAEWIRDDGQIRNIPRNTPMFRHCESFGPIWK